MASGWRRDESGFVRIRKARHRTETAFERATGFILSDSGGGAAPSYGGLAVINPHTGYREYHPSCVKLANGKILYMYSRGYAPGAVYQATFNTLSDLVTTDSVTSVTEVTVLDGLYYPKASLFQDQSGSLFYIVAYEKTTSANVAKVEVYKSASGDGSDWSLYSTVQSIAWNGTNVYAHVHNLELGVPYLYNGTLILPRVYFQLSYGYLTAWLTISTSGDAAAWTNRFYYYSGTSGFGQSTAYGSRSIGVFNGELWWSCSGSYGGLSIRFIKSSDGITWTTAITKAITDNRYFTNTMFADNEALYALASGQAAYSMFLKATTSPTAYTDFINTGFSIGFGATANYDPGTVVIFINGAPVFMQGARSDTEATTYGVHIATVGVSKGKERIR